MRIVITELTRMQEGHICVAGVDLESRRHIRPVIRRTRLTADLLERNGGPFDIGNIVDLGETAPCGTPPQVEDHAFDPTQARKIAEARSDWMWDGLSRMAETSLRALFGDSLRRDGQTCSMEVGEGIASLGFLRPQAVQPLDISKHDRPRLPISDGQFTVSLGVTDLRLYQEDRESLHVDEMWRITGFINQSAEIILSLGLTRPFKRDGDTAPRHWLQVNNIHVRDDPVWRLG
jgi:hypothetical protein